MYHLSLCITKAGKVAGEPRCGAVSDLKVGEYARTVAHLQHGDLMHGPELVASSAKRKERAHENQRERWISCALMLRIRKTGCKQKEKPGM